LVKRDLADWKVQVIERERERERERGRERERLLEFGKQRMPAGMWP